MQSLTTKYIGPSNTKGSRIQVSAERGKKTYSYDHALNAEQNHVQAAITCAKEWGWLKAGDKVVYGGYDKGYHVNIVCDYNTIEIN